MAVAAELRELRDPGDAALLARFYDELYLPAFHHQREPLEAWTRQLWGTPLAYHLSIVLAGAALGDPAHARLDGGIVSELYPRSRCGFLTYLVVAPHARRAGLGRTLLDGARAALAARGGGELRAVFGEVSDPAGNAEAAARLARFERWGARVVDLAYVQPSLGPGLPRDPALRLIAFFGGAAGNAEAAARLARFERWGARVVDLAYVQPSLGPGLPRDPALRLIAFFGGAPPASLPGAVVAAFLAELYEATEGAAPSFELPSEVPLMRGSSELPIST